MSNACPASFANPILESILFLLSWFQHLLLGSSINSLTLGIPSKGERKSKKKTFAAASIACTLSILSFPQKKRTYKKKTPLLLLFLFLSSPVCVFSFLPRLCASLLKTPSCTPLSLTFSSNFTACAAHQHHLNLRKRSSSITKWPPLEMMTAFSHQWANTP